MLLLLSLSGIFFLKIVPQGHTVIIKMNNKPVYLLPLDKDRIVSVDGPLGKSTVEIKNNRVRIVDSPCPNRLCVHQGWIEKGIIVCLPNRVTVSIDSGGKKEGATDAVTG